MEGKWVQPAALFLSQVLIFFFWGGGFFFTQVYEQQGVSNSNLQWTNIKNLDRYYLKKKKKNLPPDIAVKLLIWTQPSFASTLNMEQDSHVGVKADTIKAERRNPALPPSGRVQDQVRNPAPCWCPAVKKAKQPRCASLLP